MDVQSIASLLVGITGLVGAIFTYASRASKDDLDVLSKIVDELRKENERLKEELETLRGDYEKLRAEYDKLEAENHALRRILNDHGMHSAPEVGKDGVRAEFL